MNGRDKFVWYLASIAPDYGKANFNNAVEVRT